MKPRVPLLLAVACTAALSSPGAAPAQAPSPGAQRMKAVVQEGYGSADVLRLVEVEKPVPADDQVLVKVRAASVNPLDWHLMRGEPIVGRSGMGGLRQPSAARIGVDFAGTVEAVGRSVTRFKPGDEVFGGRTGALAEYVAVRQDRGIALKPANVTFEQAAAVPVAAITALQALRDKGRLQAGQKVLVNGASGGVGTFAVQIAKALGADVTGVCSTRNVDMVRSIGADRVIDYTREDFTRGPERYDVVVDNVGNHPLLATLRVIKPGGKYVMVGGQAGRWIEPFPRVFRALALSRLVSQEMSFFLAQLNQKDMAFLADLLQSGRMKSVIDRRYPLGEAPEAIRYLEKGHARGKVVVAVDASGQLSPVNASIAAGPAAAGRLDPVAIGVLAALVAAVVAPIAAALVLDRRHRRRNPGTRPYRWGYWVAIQSVLGAIVLAALLELGTAAAVACVALYAVLAWFFARRRHWAWIALTVLTFNPVAWIIHYVYLKKRWAEGSAAATL